MAIEQVGQVGGPATLAEGLGRQRTAERAWEGARRLPALPLAVLALFVAMALVGPWMAPLDPDATDLVARLSPPAWAGGSPDHLLGTDRLGRDVLSRIIVGARPSFVVALVTIGVGGVLGTLIGLVAGYFGGRVDA